MRPSWPKRLSAVQGAISTRRIFRSGRNGRRRYCARGGLLEPSRSHSPLYQLSLAPPLDPSTVLPRPRWHRPGLLLIGDAAHVMSPVGGVGINYAIQDAVVTANLLTAPLKSGRLREQDLAAVQRHREWPTRVIQRFQSFMQDRVLSPIIASQRLSTLPPLARLLVGLPLVQRIPMRLIALGPWPVHVRHKEGITALPTPPTTLWLPGGRRC